MTANNAPDLPDISSWLIPNQYEPPPQGTLVEREVEHRAWFQFCRFLGEKGYIDCCGRLKTCIAPIRYINFPIFSHYKDESGQHPPWIERFPIVFDQDRATPCAYRTLYRYMKDKQGFSLAASVPHLLFLRDAELPRCLKFVLETSCNCPSVTIQGGKPNADGTGSECLTVRVAFSTDASPCTSSRCSCDTVPPPSPCTKSRRMDLACITKFWCHCWWRDESCGSNESCSPNECAPCQQALVDEIVRYRLKRNWKRLMRVVKGSRACEPDSCSSDRDAGCCTILQCALCALWKLIDKMESCDKRNDAAELKTSVKDALDGFVGECCKNPTNKIDAAKLRDPLRKLRQAVDRLKEVVDESRDEGCKETILELQELVEDWRSRFKEESWRRWRHLVAEFALFLDMNRRLGFKRIWYLPLCIPVTTRNYSLPEYWGGVIIAGKEKETTKEKEVVEALRGFADAAGPNIIIPDLAQVIEVESFRDRNERKRVRKRQG